MTIRQFATRHRLTATVAWVDANPNMTDMPAGSRHYRVTLRMHGRQLTTPFSMGPAHEKEPEAAEVLDCLISDASSIESSSSFEDWAADMGWDADSRKAERTYRTIEAQTKKLRAFLGDEWDAAINAERL